MFNCLNECSTIQAGLQTLYVYLTFLSFVGGVNMQNEIYSCETEDVHFEVIERVRKLMPQSDDFYKLSELYKMFADNTRVKILWALSNETMCVCDLAALLGMTKSAISHQLKSLRQTNLVRYERQGKNIYYTLADSHVRDIFEKGFEHIHE